VAIYNSIREMLWTRYFLAYQGQHVPTTTIFQDNKDTILMAKTEKHPGQNKM